MIIPCYKKEKTILQDISNIYKVLSDTGYEFEIIAVVDGFLDNTFKEASKLKKPNVKVIGYKVNHGKGYAIRFGMAKAKGDLIAFIDAGMDIKPEGIIMLIEHMNWYNAHIVVGSKRHPVSKVNYPIIRKIYSIAYQLLVFILFRLKIKDTQTGLKVFRKEVLEDILPRLVVKQFAFDIEILAVAHHLGYTRIYEAPVEITWDPNDTTFSYKIIFDPYIRSMLVDTFAVFYRMNILKYYSR